jgi:ABC-type glycerol-3-phosphate transport system permease component
MSSVAVVPPVVQPRRPTVDWRTAARTIAAALISGIFFLPILWWILASFKPTQ